MIVRRAVSSSSMCLRNLVIFCSIPFGMNDWSNAASGSKVTCRLSPSGVISSTLNGFLLSLSGNVYVWYPPGRSVRIEFSGSFELAGGMCLHSLNLVGWCRLPSRSCQCGWYPSLP